MATLEPHRLRDRHCISFIILVIMSIPKLKHSIANNKWSYLNKRETKMFHFNSIIMLRPPLSQREGLNKRAAAAAPKGHTASTSAMQLKYYHCLQSGSREHSEDKQNQQKKANGIPE